MTLRQIIIAIVLVAAALALSLHFSPINKTATGGHHSGHGVKLGNLEISTPWTRATVKSAKVGGGFITIKNNGADDDQLVSGSANFTDRVELHEMKLVDDVMRMRPLAGGITIPAGGEVTLKPGGQHLMFLGLKEPLKEGAKVPVSLRFEKAGEVSISFKIKGLAAKSADEHSDHGDHSGHDQ